MILTVYSLLVPRLRMEKALPLMCLHGAVPKLRDSFSFFASQCMCLGMAQSIIQNLVGFHMPLIRYCYLVIFLNLIFMDPCIVV